MNALRDLRSSGRGLLAFVHIEKAAGTTLIHILRRNYFLRYCDVRPLRKGSEGVFGASDLDWYVRLNPWLRCIGGHALVPYGTLIERYPDIRFLTVMRDPIKRYISQFQYLTRERNHKFSFAEFLDDDHYSDFQVRKMAGCRNLELAKNTLRNRFVVVGIVEEFEEFLLMLSKKLSVSGFDPRYRVQNTARDKNLGVELMDRYHDEIVERNRLDIALYAHTKDEILTANRRWYGDTLQADIERLRAQRRIANTAHMKSIVDYGFRKLYVEPLTGTIRRVNGLTAKGSYS